MRIFAKLMEYQVHTFLNGIRLLFVPSASAISHACFLVKAGSRHERPEDLGVAHFIEHMLFKKTKKRNTNQILNRLESVGADLNAYTTKEYTCLHASFLKPFLDRTLELFQDVSFNSVFPEDEIIKEKGVVLDELASYQDQPEEAIYDDFEDLLFSNHPLGHNILGTINSVKAFKKENLERFIKENYRTNEMIIAVSGNYSFKRVVAIADKYYGSLPANEGIRHIPQKHTSESTNILSLKPISQAHIVLGTSAYDIYDNKKPGLLLLNNMLGGNSMSSILNLEIREKHGIAYTIESAYSPLSDTGLFTVYFGTEREKVDKALKLIYKEFKKLKSQKLSEVQLKKAKRKFIGQIALGEENRMGLLVSMAKSLMDHDVIDSLEEVFKKIEAVSNIELLEIANEILDEDRQTRLIFSPID